MATAARIYLLVGALGVAWYVAIGGSYVLYEAFSAVGVIAILVGTTRNRPWNRRGWWLLAASQLVLGAADFVYFTVYGGSPPFPSVADAFYLVGALLFVLALYRLISSRAGVRRDLMSLVDAAVLSLAVGLFLWSLFFSGALGEGTGAARVVSIAYPALDMVLLTMLIRVLLERGRRTASYFLLAGSVVLLIFSDAWYVVP